MEFIYTMFNNFYLIIYGETKVQTLPSHTQSMTVIIPFSSTTSITVKNCVISN